MNDNKVWSFLIKFLSAKDLNIVYYVLNWGVGVDCFTDSLTGDTFITKITANGPRSISTAEIQH